MVPNKTVQERQKELQLLLATAAGQEELEALAARYYEEGSRPRPLTSSVITYILVHERQEGLIGA